MSSRFSNVKSTTIRRKLEHSSKNGIVPETPDVKDEKDVISYTVTSAAVIQQQMLEMKRYAFDFEEKWNTSPIFRGLRMDGITENSINQAKQKIFGYGEGVISQTLSGMEKEIERLEQLYFNWMGKGMIKQNKMFAGYLYWTVINLLLHVIFLRRSLKPSETKEEIEAFIIDLYGAVENVNVPVVSMEDNIYLTGDNFNTINIDFELDYHVISNHATLHIQYLFTKCKKYDEFMEMLAVLSKKLMIKVMTGIDSYNPGFQDVWNNYCRTESDKIHAYLSTKQYNPITTLYTYVMAFDSEEVRPGIIPVSDYALIANYFYNQGRSLVLLGAMGMFKDNFPYKPFRLLDSGYNIYMDVMDLKRSMGGDMELPLEFYLSTQKVGSYITKSKEVELIRALDRCVIGGKTEPVLFLVKDTTVPQPPSPTDVSSLLYMSRTSIIMQFVHLYKCMWTLIVFEIEELEKEASYISGHPTQIIHSVNYIEGLRMFLYYLPIRQKGIKDAHKVLMYALETILARDVTMKNTVINEQHGLTWDNILQLNNDRIVGFLRYLMMNTIFPVIYTYFTVDDIDTPLLDTACFLHRDHVEQYPSFLKYRTVHHLLISGGYVKFSWCLTNAKDFKDGTFGYGFKAQPIVISETFKRTPVLLKSKNVDKFKSVFAGAVWYLPILDKDIRKDTFKYSNTLSILYSNMDGFNALMKSYNVNVRHYPHDSVKKGIEFHYFWLALLGRIACFKTFESMDKVDVMFESTNIKDIMNVSSKIDKHRVEYTNNVEDMFKYLKTSIDGFPVKCSMIQTFIFTNEIFKQRQKSLTSDFWFVDSKVKDMRDKFDSYVALKQQCKEEILKDLENMKYSFRTTLNNDPHYMGLIYLISMESKNARLMKSIDRKYRMLQDMNRTFTPLALLDKKMSENLLLMVKHLKNKRKALAIGNNYISLVTREVLGFVPLEETVEAELISGLLFKYADNPLLYKEDVMNISGERIYGLLTFDTRCTVLLLFVFVLKLNAILNTVINNAVILESLTEEERSFLNELRENCSQLRDHSVKGLSLFKDDRRNGKDGPVVQNEEAVWDYIQGYISQDGIFDKKDKYESQVSWFRDKDEFGDRLISLLGRGEIVDNISKKIMDFRNNRTAHNDIITPAIGDTANFFACIQNIRQILKSGFFDDDLYDIYQYATMNDLKVFLAIKNNPPADKVAKFRGLANVLATKAEYINLAKSVKLLDMSALAENGSIDASVVLNVDIPHDEVLKSESVQYNTIMALLTTYCVYFAHSPYLKSIDDVLAKFDASSASSVSLRGVPLFHRKFEMMSEDSQTMETWIGLELVPYLTGSSYSLFEYMKRVLDDTDAMFQRYIVFLRELIELDNDKVKDFFVLLYSHVQNIPLPNAIQYQTALNALNISVDAYSIFSKIIVVDNEIRANLLLGVFFLIMILRNGSSEDVYSYESLQTESMFVPTCIRRIYAADINKILNGKVTTKFSALSS